MLGKLLKYDIKAMFRIFIPLWGVLLAVSVLNRVFSLPMSGYGDLGNLFSSVMLLLNVLIIVAVMVTTTVLIIVRFYQGLLKDEGYLMFTLPVRTWQLILSKLLSAMAVSLLSGIVSILSVCILSSYAEVWEELSLLWAELQASIPNLGGLVALFVVSLFAGQILAIVQVYAAMALGHLAGRHRVGFSVLAYIVLNIAITTVSTPVGLMVSTIPDTPMLTIELEQLLNRTLVTSMGLGLVLSVVFTIVFFFLTNYILSRRLNLE